MLSELHLDSKPIDIEWIASKRGIPVRTEVRFPKDCYGALMRSGNVFSVLVWAGCFNSGHRRFTIAHELGHYHLDGHIDALLTKDATALSQGGNYRGQKDPFEVEADAFASELLMPTPLVVDVVRDRRPGLDLVLEISRDFDVSLSAAAVRLVSASEVPAVVLLTRDHALEWLSFSPHFDQHVWSRRRRRGDWAPPKSATTLLARNAGDIVSGATRTGTGLLSEWFEEAPSIEFGEEALGLGQYGRVLTVLSGDALPDADESGQGSDSSEEAPTDWRDALRPYRLG